jgi:prevent-host-death family protein
MQVNILQAKNRLSQLIKDAQAGEEVVIANRGQPLVKLVRLSPTSRPHTHTGASLLNWLHAHPLPPRLRRDPAQIAAALQAERGAWD